MIIPLLLTHTSMSIICIKYIIAPQEARVQASIPKPYDNIVGGKECALPLYIYIYIYHLV